MAKRTAGGAAQRGSGGEVRGAFGAPGSPPFGAVWRDERDLYAFDGRLDEAAKRRLREWRQRGKTWARLGSDGRIQVACDPTQPDRPLRVGDVIGADAGANVDDVVRHIELERRLRLGPYVGDGSDERRLVRFPLTLDEWKELRVLRETHGEGEEWGEGEERIYWRSKCEDNVVSIHRRLPRLILRGRALS